MPLKESKKGFHSIDKKLPEIVNHHNINKDGVDTVDHLISLYSCGRKTNRWTMNCFYYLIDLAASNAFILFAMNKNNKNETLLNDVPIQKRKSIEQLAFEFVSKIIKSRAAQLGSNNFQGVYSDLQINLKRSLNIDELSIYKSRPKIARLNQSPESKRCEFCQHEPQNQLWEIKTKRQDCHKFCCKNDSIVVNNIFCHKYLNQ